MLPAIAVACTLSFTAPCYEPDLRDTLHVAHDACWDSSRYHIPERALRGEVIGWPMNGPYGAMRDTVPVTPCLRQSIIVPWDGSPWTFQLRMIDQAGNADPCPMRVAKGNWPVGVGEPPAPVAPSRPWLMRAIDWYARPKGADWFDMSGRRLREPPGHAGIYVELVRGRAPWKFVVLE